MQQLAVEQRRAPTGADAALGIGEQEGEIGMGDLNVVEVPQPMSIRSSDPEFAERLTDDVGVGGRGAQGILLGTVSTANRAPG